MPLSLGGSGGRTIPAPAWIRFDETASGSGPAVPRCPGDDAGRCDYLPGMSQPPPVKPKLTSAEQRQRREDRIACIRLRMAIGQELDERGITTPAAIGEALGMEAEAAHGLLNRRQWRDGDVASLQAAATRLGLSVRTE
jgi:hypothetical protein